MSDGAHLGIDAHSAMKAAIAGEPTPPPITTQAMGERIMATTRETATDYGAAADYIAKLILLAFRADLELAKAPTERTYSRRDDGTTDWSTVVVPDLYDRLKDRLSPEDAEFIGGCTGFMWGWAVNAARAVMELPPVPNPAIITVGSS